jgi:hypothetical protein
LSPPTDEEPLESLGCKNKQRRIVKQILALSIDLLFFCDAPLLKEKAQRADDTTPSSIVPGLTSCFTYSQ